MKTLHTPPSIALPTITAKMTGAKSNYGLISSYNEPNVNPKTSQ